MDDQKLNYEEDFVDYVNTEYRKRQSERIPFELTWRLNSEFIKGNQFLSINTALRKIEEVPKMYWWQEREVHNQIATIVDTRVARLSRQKPILKTRPFSNDEDDLQKSKISSMILNMKWYDEKMDNKYHDMVTWLEHTGNVFLKTTWDSAKGKMIGVDVKTTIQEIDGFEFPKEEQVEVFEGDIDVTTVSPYEMYPDSCSRNGLSECKSLIHARAFHVKDIEDMYGIPVDEEQVDGFALQSGSGLGGITYNAGGYKSKSERLTKHAVVKEYYERPTKKYPEGRFIVVAGDKLLHEGPLPYKVGEDGKPDFPFVQAKSIVIPNTFWGQSVVERCIPIQRRYNALRNRKAEYLNLVSIGQWYEPIGSLDDDSELNNSPANRIRYHPGAGRPEPVVFPSLPNSFEMEERSLLSEFTAVSGVSELSRFSEAPSGVKSGVALSIANEQDDTRIAVTSLRMADAIRDIAQHWLRLYKQFAQEPRLVRSVGEDVDIATWMATDLQSEDIIIENSSALAETPAQRRQMVFDLIGTGIFNRPETNPFTREGVHKILELIEMGHWESGSEDDYRLQENKAKRENRSFLQGVQAIPAEFDNHEIHIAEHNKFRMTPDYEALLRSPEGQYIAQIIDQHVNQHRFMLHQQQMAVVQQQPIPQNEG